MEFKASLDIQAKVITGFTIVLFVAIGWRCAQDIMNRSTDLASVFGLGVPFLIFGAGLIITFLLAPQKYMLSHEELIIKRPLKDVVIKLSNIGQVYLVPENAIIFSLRTLGSGGLFGYFGRYYNIKLGNYTAYATRRDNRLMIVTKEGQKIVLSPDDVNMFSHIDERKPLI